MSGKISRGLLFLYIILNIIFFTHNLAQGQNAGAETQNCLWKVPSENNTVYLLGSIHLLKKENYPLNHALEQAFTEAQVLVLEIHPDSINLPANQYMTLMQAMSDSGENLQNELTTETYELAQARLAELGLNIESLHQFKPWFVAVTIATLELQKKGFASEYGIDMYFFKKAKNLDKRVISLESVAFQLEMLASMADENQNLFLLQTLKDLEIIEQEINKIVTAWTCGDTRALENTLLESFKEYPEVYDNIISLRNKNWLSQIELFLQQTENYLVIVGAGHLVGPDGLISLLQQKGYTVEQL